MAKGVENILVMFFSNTINKTRWNRAEEVVDSRMDFVLDKLAASNRLDVTVDIDGKLLLLSLLFDDVDDVDDDSSCALVWNMLQFSNCKLRKPKGRLVGWLLVYSLLVIVPSSRNNEDFTTVAR